MFLKRLKLTNYRKFSSEKNIVEFISSKIVLNQDNDDINALSPKRFHGFFDCLDGIDKLCVFTSL